MASKRKSPPPSNSVSALRSGKRGTGSAAGAGNAGKSSGSGPGARSTAWENIKAVVVTIVIFLVIRAFLMEAYRIPSGSMIPTLLVGDWLFVNKLAYGPNIPFTDVNLPGYDEPERNDVIVFVSPPQSDQPWDPTPMLVKRCVAVAGDTIQMKSSVLFVNGVAKPQGPEASVNGRGDGSFSVPLFEWQKKFEIRGSRFGEPAATSTLDDWGPMVVPPRRLFMLGDNRYDSKDSRYWGFVPRENLRGRPLFVYYSYRSGESTDALPFLTDIRWGRIGTVIR